MYKEKTIAVVVPAYREELLIRRVIETMPEFVDHIIIVDDASPDRTCEIVESYIDKFPNRITLIRLPKNQGVGGAIAEGYKWCRDNRIDATAVMAGDAQMDPEDLPALLDPVIEDKLDYSKGNRLISGEAWEKVPRVRYLGNAGLSFLTKIASGYWHIADSQTGYTVANLKVLQTLNLDDIYKRYGMPNDILVKLNIFNFRVGDVEIRPVYGNGEKSGIKPLRIIPKLAFLLFKLFLYRMVQKYIIRDFHPLILFYGAGFFLMLLDLGLAIRMFYWWIFVGHIPPINALAVMFCAIAGLQLFLFAMWFDMEYNKNLR
ncbi:MAG: glycosyltransferase family 2 protein [Anaerolineales bacterium]|nr:MAG: glycosyltransferase family 2 protein [Anaerolineales bacterium]